MATYGDLWPSCIGFNLISVLTLFVTILKYTFVPVIFLISFILIEILKRVIFKKEREVYKWAHLKKKKKKRFI